MSRACQGLVKGYVKAVPHRPPIPLANPGDVGAGQAASGTTCFSSDGSIAFEAGPGSHSTPGKAPQPPELFVRGGGGGLGGCLHCLKTPLPPPPSYKRCLEGRDRPHWWWGECPLGRTWPMARAVALLRVDPTRGSETGTVRGLRWHALPRERKGVWGRRRLNGIVAKEGGSEGGGGPPAGVGGSAV